MLRSLKPIRFRGWSLKESWRTDLEEQLLFLEPIELPFEIRRKAKVKKEFQTATVFTAGW